MKIHPACQTKEYGWVEVNDIDENPKAVNCVVQPIHMEILDSDFYKNKEGVFWPKVTKLTDYNPVNPCLACYETEYFHHIIRYSEFTPEQFVEALIFISDVMIYCYENGYHLRTHLWNVTFVKSSPILIDIRDFEIYKGQSPLSVFTSHFRKTLDNHCPIPADHFIINFDFIRDNLNIAKDIYGIKSVLLKCKVRNVNNGVWSSYHNNRTDFLNSECLNDELYDKIKNYAGGSGDPTKSNTIFKVLEDIKPKTVTEIGCNNGLYCFGASRFGWTVGIDYDIVAIDNANKINKKIKERCQFVHLDILNPEKSLYNHQKYSVNNAYGLPNERFKSEMLLAPAVVHHLYKACGSLKKIIDIFDSYAEIYMLIEHINDVYSYTELIENINIKWNIVDIYDSSPSPRKFILCKRK